MAIKNKKVETISFKVSNTDIILGQTYEVVPKYDADAPDGFKKHGTTKLLMSGIGETHQVPFDETMGIWDTGFDEISLSNTDIPKEERAALVTLYNKYIKDIYEGTFGKDLSAKDVENSFWKTYRFEVWNGKEFDTNNIKDLLELFLVLKHYKVCEKGEKSYLARAAAYNITNKEQVMTIADQRNEDKAEAIYTYMTLEKGDTETLYTVLEWLQFTNVRASESKTLSRAVMAYLEKDHVNVENFLAAYRKTQNKVGREEMDNFILVMKLFNKKLITYKRREYYLNDEVIGNSHKDIAKRAISDAKLLTALIEASEKLQ